jgi:hypothetical protein
LLTTGCCVPAVTVSSIRVKRPNGSYPNAVCDVAAVVDDEPIVVVRVDRSPPCQV